MPVPSNTRAGNVNRVHRQKTLEHLNRFLIRPVQPDVSGNAETDIAMRVHGRADAPRSAK
jgi:hypothetical protein